MRLQSLRALTYLLAVPVSLAAASVSVRWTRREAWERRCCNNPNRPEDRSFAREWADVLRRTEVTCGA